jgi:gliding motility-associated lipoprotein GldD
MYPDYARIVQDTLFFDEKPINPCWFDVEFLPFNGKLHCSYYPIMDQNGFEELISDAFTFVDKHDIKANYRAETQIMGKEGTGGILFEIDGPVATPIQFFLTDSTDHFIRGSLYFNNKVNPDSMAPVHQFVTEEIKKMLETLAFKSNN